jgi:pyruvate dehydrogenase E1 component beta subunit
MPLLNMVDALNLAFDQEMAKDKSVVLLGEDVGVLGGVFRVTAGLQKKYGKERVIDTPLAEAGIVGTSIGMAIYGLKPVAECQFSGFIYPAFQQLVSHAARIRTRSRGSYTCPMVLRAPYSGGVRALEHHSESMEAIFSHVQGLKVVIPSTPTNAKGLLISAIRDPDPVIFLEPKRVYRSFKEEVPEKEYTIPLGKADVIEEGDDLTVISWGASLHETLNAVAEVDYSCEVIDLQTISPLDTETIINSVKKTGRCLIVHEAPRSGGIAAEIIAQINEKCLLQLEAPIERVTGFDVPMPYPKLEKKYIPDEFRIKKGIEKVMNF